MRKLGLAFLGLLLATGLFLSGCGGKTGGKKEGTPPAPQTQQQSQQPAGGKEGAGVVKVGILLPYTGVYTSLGENITRGMEMYFAEVGNKAGGKTIEVIKEDTKADPQVGLQKARKLVENDKVDLLAGIVHSGVALAVRDYVDAQKVPLIIANAGAVDITRGKASPYIFRTSFSNGQYEHPLGRYAVEKMNIKKIVIFAPDYSAGKEKSSAFIKEFKKAGGEVVQEIYPPLGTNDFSAFLGQVKQADGVWAFFAGSDAIRFVQQYAEYGLKKRMPLLGAGDLVDEAFLPSQKDAALGVVTSLHYSPALETEENQKFVKAYQAKYNQMPNQFSEQGYVAARVIVEALNAVQGNTSDKDAFLKAIKAVKFNAPQGPFSFDQKTQNVVFNVYIRKVEKLPDGSYVNKVLDKLENVHDSGY